METKILIILILISVIFPVFIIGQGDFDLPNPGLTPDNHLYFLDVLGEKIGMFFTFGAEKKAEKALKYAEEKLAEAEAMAEEKKDKALEKSNQRYQKFLDLANNKAGELKEKGEDIERLVTLIAEKTLKHQEVLLEVLEHAPVEALKGIENAIEISEMGFRKAVKAMSGIKKEELKDVETGIQQKIKRIIEEKKATLIEEAAEEEGVKEVEATEEKLVKPDEPKTLEEYRIYCQKDQEECERWCKENLKICKEYRTYHEEEPKEEPKEEPEEEPEEILLPEHCMDGIYNEGEKGLDCGWTCPKECDFSSKCGRLQHDETWSGNIQITCYVEVPAGVTLTIEPGTIVKLKHDRNYKTFNKAGLGVRGGTIRAVGTKDKMIWFTSDAPDPINGDWWGINVNDSADSEFRYVIVEFGELGISQFDSAVPVKNSIIRWNNSEGLYAERSKPVFENNRLYSNGYHEIALEQYNEVVIRNNIFHDGVCGVHNEKTKSHIEGNYFDTYKWPAITAGMGSELEIIGNRFRNIALASPYAIYDGSTAEIENNDLGDNHIPVPTLDFEDIKNFEIDYIPGDENDRYPYVYDDEDETRRVLKKIGEGLSFGWALDYMDGYLYRFTLGDVEFVRVDPNTGNYERLGNDGIMNPRGLVHDDEFFYVNDFSLKKIFKFKVENNRVRVYGSFDIPEKEKGGTMAMTTDGDFLYLRSRDGTKLYQLEKSGELVKEIVFENGFAQAIVWTGEYFWTWHGCGKGLCKWTKDGRLVGEAYLPAKDTWALTWDGNYLWSIQRTSEMWDDPKIYQIDILNDSLEGGQNTQIIYDAHAHLFGIDKIGELIGAMNQNNIGKCVLFGSCYQYYLDQNAYASGYDKGYNPPVAEVYNLYPEKFYSCLSGFDPQDDRVIEYVENQLLTGNFKCIGELYLVHGSLPNYKSIADGTVMQAIWNLSTRYNAPVFFHYERWVQSDIEALYDMFEKYPDTKFVWLHFGHNPGLYVLEDELERFPNVYYEMEELPVRLSSDMKRIFEKYPTRFLLGTDTGCTNQIVTTQNHDYSLAISMHRQLLSQLSQETADNIAYKNLIRLFSD